MKTNEERLQDMLSHLSSLSHIDPSDIPNIHLYMDQVTTFMEENLGNSRRYPDDKILTKTMINNYTKNHLLPSPVNKRYSKDHILLLIFIYYFKSLLSFHDIEELFRPITNFHFSGQNSGLNLEDIYNEIFSLEKEHMEDLKQSLKKDFDISQKTFQNIQTDEEDQEYLRLFSFICQLSFDVYIKKQLIELVADQLREEMPPETKRKK